MLEEVLPQNRPARMSRAREGGGGGERYGKRGAAASVGRGGERGGEDVRLLNTFVNTRPIGRDNCVFWVINDSRIGITIAHRNICPYLGLIVIRYAARNVADVRIDCGRVFVCVYAYRAICVENPEQFRWYSLLARASGADF